MRGTTFGPIGSAPRARFARRIATQNKTEIIMFFMMSLMLRFFITSLRANYLQPKIYDKIAATDTECKCSVNSFSLH